MTRFKLLLAAILAAAVAAPSVADAQAVPGAIKVPVGNKAFLTAHAVGVQIYACNGTAWTLTGPRADLYDDHGNLVATHFAGPTWQSKGGSAVIGKRENGATVDAASIDWLLLSATSTTPGRLGGTTYIQRINTTGGRANATDCNAATAGATVEVPYTADYVFWRAHHG
jgi:hypothetical protein